MEAQTPSSPQVLVISVDSAQDCKHLQVVTLMDEV